MVPGAMIFSIPEVWDGRPATVRGATETRLVTPDRSTDCRPQVDVPRSTLIVVRRAARPLVRRGVEIHDGDVVSTRGSNGQTCRRR